MIRWNVRNQVLTSGLVGLLVIVAVIVYFYTFTKSGFATNSERLLGLMESEYAGQMERLFEDRAAIFESWTREDIFGLAIEFNTTGEVQRQFEEWLTETPGFAAMLLTDARGTVLEAATSREVPSPGSSLTGRVLSDWSRLQTGTSAGTVILHSQALASLGVTNDLALAFVRPSYGSSGDLNGAAVGFASWSAFDGLAQQYASALKAQGFPEAVVVLTDPRASDPLLSRAGAKGSRIHTEDIVSYAGLSSGAEVGQQDLGGESVFAAVDAVALPAGDKEGSGTTARLRLAAVVPESVVMAQLKSELIVVLVVGILGTLVVLALSYYTARRLSRRAATVGSVAQRMAAGDLSQSVRDEASDEIGDLARSFGNLSGYIGEMADVAQSIAANDLTVKVKPKSEADVLGRSFEKMVENLSGVVTRLADSASDLVQAAKLISESSESISSGVDDQAQRVAQVSTALEEMAATIVQSSRSAGEAADASKAAAEEVSRSVGQISQITSQAAEGARQSAEAAKELNEQSEELNAIGRSFRLSS